MQDFNQYCYTIKEENLLKVLREYAARGGNPIVVLNGEYYNIQFEEGFKNDSKKK